MTNLFANQPTTVGQLAVTLRPYQQAAVDSLYQWFETNSGNPLVVVPTGGGKSLIIAAFVHSVHSQWPKERILVLTHVRELIEQNHAQMLRAWPTAPAGIYSAGIGRREHDAPVLFAGIQSVYEKAERIGWTDLVIVDEAHLIPAKGMGMYRTFLDALRSMNPHLKVIGLTATPFRTDTGSLADGDGRMFHGVAYDCDLLQLIADGYLSPVTSKGTKAPIDTSAVAVRMGEFAERELEAAAMAGDVVPRAVTEIVSRGQDRKAWLLFCCGIAHANLVLEQLRAHGISSAAVFGETKKHERDQVVADFKSGKLRAIVNVGVLCLDDQTEILTSEGWTGIDQMTPSHLVAAWDTDGSVRFARPSNIVRRKRGQHERMVSLEGRNHSIRVTANHRMVSRRRDGEWAIASAESLVGEQVFIPVSGIADPFDLPAPSPYRASLSVAARVRALSYVRRRSGYSPDEARASATEHVMRAEGRKFRAPKELTLDECAFVGFWLGDGSMSGGRCVLSQSNTYPKIIAWFDDVLARTGLSHSKHEKAPSESLPRGYVVWSINRGTGGMAQRRNCGYFHLTPYLAKEGTDLFWGLSEKQLDALMHGFWMADGNHGDGTGGTTRGKSISGTQRKLYECLQAVMACRGWRGTVTLLAPPKKPSHSQQWRFSWRRAADSLLMRERLQFEPGWRPERVWCVTSATGNIITRRSGKVAVVGNTTGFDAPQTDLVVLLRPTMSPGLYVQMVGRGLRLATGKKDALVLDFGGNVLRHGPIDQVKIKQPGKKGEPGIVPARECPQCQELVGIMFRQCPSCGFEWGILDGEVGSKHDDKPAEAPILGTPKGSPIERWAVNFTRYMRHDKPGKTSSLRVDYECGFQQRVSEWVCFEHPAGSFPRKKAEQWWIARGGALPVPETVDLAMVRQECGALREVATVTVDTRGEYPELRGVRLREAEAGAVDFSEPVKGSGDVDYSDLPF